MKQKMFIFAIRSSWLNIENVPNKFINSISLQNLSQVSFKPSLLIANIQILNTF